MLSKRSVLADLSKAQKEQKEPDLTTLRLLLANLINREKEKRYRLTKEKNSLREKELEDLSQLTEKEILEAIFFEAKKRKEAISAFETARRRDLVEKEKKELEVLERYLPALLPEKEIAIEAQKIIEKLGARDLKDLGRVMAELMPLLKARAEGVKVQKVVHSLLNSKTKSQEQ